MDKKTMNEVLSWIEVIVVAFVIAFLIRGFIFEPITVNGDSMIPTLHNGDDLIVFKLPYRFSPPKYGDIIVFKYPSDPRYHYIKRVIGLPGDSIEIKDGEVYVNGKKLIEPYINEKTLMDFKLDKVPDDTVFVLGDNRNWSRDSRYPDVGPVPFKNIIGKATIRIWPLNKFGLLR
ncbi:signal peptidase I [Calorimonas adulescens]|jgi:signal peptidase I (EC 3.4.21.89). Serine peptidase. MEROPS family S26A|uniref:Signal peptidase I n=2 Tax=Calorimonas adulescens TaxID=2606906 RepID=A0A5D8QFT7_9THEO|nr:signal peptidase I [Calorimonas adulescens]